jgi:flagellar assembly protein FliH
MSGKFEKLQAGTTIEVQNFELPDLNGDRKETFRTPTLGASLPKGERVKVKAPADDQKSRRFHVDPVLRDLLSIDEEAESEVDRRVEVRIAELRGEAEASGREAGYDAGYARGKAEASANFEASAKERLAQFDGFLDAVESLKDEFFRANERFLVELVFRIASNVLQREIKLDPEYLGRLVRSVVEKVGAREQVKLIANASRIEGLYALLPELEKKHSSLKNVTVEISSQLEEADVVIETDWNRIDATLATQMETLHETLIAGLEETQERRNAESTGPSGDDDGEKESA